MPVKTKLDASGRQRGVQIPLQTLNPYFAEVLFHVGFPTARPIHPSRRILDMKQRRGNVTTAHTHKNETKQVADVKQQKST